MTYLKRYSIAPVFRESKVLGSHPRECFECQFDIVTPSPGRSVNWLGREGGSDKWVWSNQGNPLFLTLYVTGASSYPQSTKIELVPSLFFFFFFFFSTFSFFLFSFSHIFSTFFFFSLFFFLLLYISFITTLGIWVQLWVWPRARYFKKEKKKEIKKKTKKN